jgi:hypothetical protein
MEGTTAKTRRMWEDNIKMDLEEIRSDGVNWIGVGVDREKWCAVVNTVMNHRVT